MISERQAYLASAHAINDPLQAMHSIPRYFSDCEVESGAPGYSTVSFRLWNKPPRQVSINRPSWNPVIIFFSFFFLYVGSIARQVGVAKFVGYFMTETWPTEATNWSEGDEDCWSSSDSVLCCVISSLDCGGIPIKEENILERTFPPPLLSSDGVDWACRCCRRYCTPIEYLTSQTAQHPPSQYNHTVTRAT